MLTGILKSPSEIMGSECNSIECTLDFKINNEITIIYNESSFIKNRDVKRLRMNKDWDNFYEIDLNISKEHICSYLLPKSWFKDIKEEIDWTQYKDKYIRVNYDNSCFAFGNICYINDVCIYLNCNEEDIRILIKTINSISILEIKETITINQGE